MYKLEIAEEINENNEEDFAIQEVGAESANLFAEFTHDQISKLRPSDFIKILHSFNNQIMMLRRKMTQHERDRLQINYDKIPKDILYLTKTEAQLKKELVLCIETGDQFLQV